MSGLSSAKYSRLFELIRQRNLVVAAEARVNRQTDPSAEEAQLFQLEAERSFES